MHWLSHLKKPTKIFIIIMMFVTFIFLAIIVYLEVTNNSMLESMSHYFVGDTESEITVDEVIPHGKLEIKDDSLDEGVTETRQEGKDGRKKIIFRVTKDKDGNETNRVFAGEEIIDEAEDEIIAIGTKVPAPVSNNYGQNGWSNNSGSQSYGGGGGSQTSGSNSQPSSNSSQPSSGNNTPSQDDSNVTYYYYAWPPQWNGMSSWRQVFVKTSAPMSEAATWMKEISSAEFYSHPSCSAIGGGPNAVEYTCEKNCGNDYSAGYQPPCKEF